jgi:hypothetical protein
MKARLVCAIHGIYLESSKSVDESGEPIELVTPCSRCVPRGERVMAET